MSFCGYTLHHTPKHTATHCNTLQHTATHCNTLQHTATHCNTLQHTATHSYIRKSAPYMGLLADQVKARLQHTATRCKTLQHTTTHEPPIRRMCPQESLIYGLFCGYTGLFCEYIGLFDDRYLQLLTSKSPTVTWPRLILNALASPCRTHPV